MRPLSETIKVEYRCMARRRVRVADKSIRLVLGTGV